MPLSGKTQFGLAGSLLVFIRARCVRVRQKLVPRNLSATHNLARDVPLLSIGRCDRDPLIQSAGQPGTIENSQLVFSYDI